MIAILLGALVACETSSTTDTGGIDPGFGTQDASGDVSMGNCKVDFGVVTCQLEIHNSSDGRSDYYIEASFTDADGVNVGSGNAYVQGIEGGQDAKTDLIGTISGGGKDVHVKITTVQRTAS
jgi:hypothetical protein